MSVQWPLQEEVGGIVRPSVAMVTHRGWPIVSGPWSWQRWEYVSQWHLPKGRANAVLQYETGRRAFEGKP